MGRRREPQIKQRLLDACTDYALEHGLPDRLSPLAAAPGPSSRMLLYHFETRDGLLREVLGQARQRQVEAFTDLIRLRPAEPYPVTLARAWSAISGPQGEPYSFEARADSPARGPRAPELDEKQQPDY